MGFSTNSLFLLCEEDTESVFGSQDDGEELGTSLDFAGLRLDSDELVPSLLAKETEQLADTATSAYLERLNNGGLELSWRTESIDWICKIQAYFSFGPLCVYLAVNYLDRFISVTQLPNDTPWMQQLLAVACISLAAKMEETVVPQSLDLQVCDAKYVFEATAIQKMEVIVLTTLKWRTHSVTPFSYIDNFLNMFVEGKPLPYHLLPRCTKLILDSMKETKFVRFKPSEIAAAVALSAAAESQVVNFDNALAACNIPVDKENVRRCREEIQAMVLEIINAESPSGVLDRSCFMFISDEIGTPEPLQTTTGNNENNIQACSPASKRTRMTSSPMFRSSSKEIQLAC